METRAAVTAPDDVRIWLQRNFMEDIIISITKNENSNFVMHHTDGTVSGNRDYIFRAFSELEDYLELMVENVMIDNDKGDTQILYFQYSIPGFPSVMSSIHKLKNDENYKTNFFDIFSRTVNFYFRQMA